MRRLRTAAEGTRRLTIGFMPGITLTPVVRLLPARHPGLDVRMLRTGWHDQVVVLRDGRADVGIVRLPIDRAGLAVVPLYTEPRVAVVASEHRLAGKDSFRIADLAEDHLLQDPDAVPEWGDVAVEVRTGTHHGVPVIHNDEEKLELVAAGEGIAIIPASTADFYTRAGVEIFAVEDLGPNNVAAAWPAGEAAVMVREFADAAAELLPEPHAERQPKAPLAGRTR